MSGAFAVQVFAEAHVEHPMQFVFDAPVLADHRIEPRRIRLEAGDGVADCALDFAGYLVVPFALDTYQPLQRLAASGRCQTTPA